MSETTDALTSILEKLRYSIEHIGDDEDHACYHALSGVASAIEDTLDDLRRKARKSETGDG